MNRRHRVALIDTRETTLRHLENREKRHHHVIDALDVVEELFERASSLETQSLGELRHPVLNRNALGRDLKCEILLGALEYRLERIEQLEKANPSQWRRP